ncbi:maltotransferase domain-containing protein [Paraburkholderia kururiensis]|uniref:maltotransferase domain-containing protein n=1 Tax=Paraburkholderia kururiensis TaxID=984307 RepID=UPI00034575FC|nr:maltotransferase domain-containing protein [Paraburkholderia kururiensis]
MEFPHAYAPRIYFVHSVLVGPFEAWPAQFAHAAALGFDHVLIGGLFQPGRAGHALIVGDHARLHPVFDTVQPATEALRELADAANEHGLTLLADLAIDRVAADGALFAAHADWFHPFEAEEARLDPRHGHRDDNVAYANFSASTASGEGPLVDWWTQQLIALGEAGVGGVRFDSPHCVPAAVWRRLIRQARARVPSMRFLAATPGLARHDVAALEGVGFDSVFSSLRWWDYRSSWLTEEHAALRRVAAPIAFPEAPYGTRLRNDFADAADASIVERAYRRALYTAASVGTGWLMPMGFEYGVAEPIAFTRGSAGHFAHACTNAPFDLSTHVTHANALQRDTLALDTSGELRLLSSPGAPVAALLRGDHADLRDAQEAVLIVVNPELAAPVHADPARFLDGVPGAFTRFLSLDAVASARGAFAGQQPATDADTDTDTTAVPEQSTRASQSQRQSQSTTDAPPMHTAMPNKEAANKAAATSKASKTKISGANVASTAQVSTKTKANVEAPHQANTAPMPQPLAAFTLAAGACRLFAAVADPPVNLAPPLDKPKDRKSGHKTVLDAIAAPRIAIESVSPAVDHGRFVAKRVVGERVEVKAAIFAEGHDRIAAAVIWRAADETAWHEAPMTAAQPAGTDLWTARIPLERVGRHEFTVIAWRDDFASLVDHVQKKLNAGQSIDLELQEGAHLLALVLAEAETAEGADTAALERIVKHYAKAHGDDRRDLLLAPVTAAAVAAARHRPFLSRDPLVYRIDAERAEARFASWYEIFPRSMSDDESRHGTFDDVIAKLPRIRDMGFDVLYFPPIHPIGLANRKGRNNTLNAEPGDVGSPYAIGAAEGGHTAVHPQLGTLDDFRRMLAAAHAHGLEIALDFAIQCSPDHPWLGEHPTWFAWRPDGTLRYAENPPKKYQDIVNPDFYAHDAKPDLWLALRDVILFWIDAGVRIFRVDNPHTKPLPFWEWTIGDVRARHPDVLFLSEAFTRPRLMYRLAKIGFSQSYTYFTWRESKRDFTEYLTELTQTEVREFFRPNFFVNTPDINPRHLQSSGRSGFLIRAALAATLSGLWGVYSGFELCEARALPNSEEYLDSEKYQLRAWDWNRPGNIVAEIAALNRVRRANPALHTHLGITFLPAHNEHILCFEKATEARDNVIVVAINLDPFNEQGADFELSWHTFHHWHLDDHARLKVVEETSGEHFEWHGRWQHVRLDPGRRPFAIWRIEPAQGLPRIEPVEPEAADLTRHPELSPNFPNEGAT